MVCRLLFGVLASGVQCFLWLAVCSLSLCLCVLVCGGGVYGDGVVVVVVRVVVGGGLFVVVVVAAFCCDMRCCCSLLYAMLLHCDLRV